MRISKRTVDAAAPALRPHFLWDDALPGFGVVVHPTGRKVYVVQYRNRHGRTRRLALGAHGVLGDHRSECQGLYNHERAHAVVAPAVYHPLSSSGERSMPPDLYRPMRNRTV